MRRSAFLRATSSGMLAQALPVRAHAASGDAVEYDLTAAPLHFVPAPGVRFDGLAYNGTIPGPLLRVVRGQRLRVRYRNRTAQATTVHWHGMVLPNDMDGVAGITQPPVEPGETFVYEYAPGPAGTRWYHDHAMDGKLGLMRGLFGMIVVEDPRDEHADAEFALVFHDVPSTRSAMAAMRGRSDAPMVDPPHSLELLSMRAGDRMGDEVSYVAHCINGVSYPHGAALQVRVGKRVRLRILNANPTQTRYVRLAEHRLHVTHADGNRLERPIDVDALRIGVAERYDAWFEVRKPGAWLLQGVSTDPLEFEQALVVRTPGAENVAPAGSSSSLEGVDFFTYEKAGGIAPHGQQTAHGAHVEKHLVLDGGRYGSSAWTINGKAWPDTEKLSVARGDRILVRLTNKTDMHHPMHLHGHAFRIVEINGKILRRPLVKDVALVDPYGGTLAWEFEANSPPGRWLLHCHNDIHMMGGMMTEVDYR